jgi:hypothetical protein
MQTYPDLDTKVTPSQLDLYHAHLQHDHDYRVWADVLTLEETFVREVDILDGQVNVQRNSDGPVRTGSLVLSDPEGALSFGTAYARDADDVLWVNRLLQINHATFVPALGFEVRAICGVGVPMAVNRKGGEIGIEWGDKSLLANHGVRPKRYKRGANVRDVLISILKDQTGERNFRIPPALDRKGNPKTLSRAYNLGMGENSLTPWELFQFIAKRELNWISYYSCDGFATAHPPGNASTKVVMNDLLNLPDASTSFADFINYVKVTSVRKKVDKNGTPKDAKDDVKVTTTREAVAVLSKKHVLSEQSLARNGVPRTLPLVVVNNDLKTDKDVKNRAKLELLGGSGLDSEQGYEVMPVFHLDVTDKFMLPEGIDEVPFNEVAIPLGTSANMSIGRIKWVSKPVTVRSVRFRKRVKRKKKGGNRDD